MINCLWKIQNRYLVNDDAFRLFEDAAKVSVLPDVCSECEAQLMRVEYKEGKSKLSNDKLSAQVGVNLASLLLLNNLV